MRGRSRRDADEAAYAEFAVARTPALYRAAYLMCGDAHRAEDLVQETLAKVYVRWRRPLAAPIDNPAAYAQTTLTRTFISEQRRRSSTERPYAEPPDDATEDPVAEHDLRLDLREALGSLSAEDRAVLVLRYLEDLSVEEVADRMGVSAGAVKNRSMRALARMRERSLR